MARPGIALQMYTLRDDARADFIGTLRKVAGVGYTAIELAGYGGLSGAALKSALDEIGLRAISAHVGLDRLQGSLEQEVEIHRVLGNRDLVCPALPQAFREDEAGFQRAAEALNAIGRRCRELEVRFSYHNHAFEFQRFGGRTGLEIILDGTDPGLVAWEPDVYWVAYAKEEPAHWLRRYAGRCPLVHLKDMTAGANPTYAEVGEGILDFEPIFAATSDAEWYIVEQDTCQRPALESVTISLQHLRQWGRA